MDERTRARLVREIQQAMVNSKLKGNEMFDQAKKDHEIIQEILRILDGKQWTVDMLDDIAGLLNSNGYTIREPE